MEVPSGRFFRLLMVNRTPVSRRVLSRQSGHEGRLGHTCVCVSLCECTLSVREGVCVGV